MVEGLTTSAPDPGSGTGSNRDIGSQHNTTRSSISTSRRPRSKRSSARTQPITSSSRILVTLAERPYPFPSRTRKSSSPAPKILRGQPFGKIGRRQDLVLSGRPEIRALGAGPIDPRRVADRSAMLPAMTMADPTRRRRRPPQRRPATPPPRAARRRPPRGRGLARPPAARSSCPRPAAGDSTCPRATTAARPSARRRRSRPRSRRGCASRTATSPARPTSPRSSAREDAPRRARGRARDPLGPRPNDDRHRGSRWHPRSRARRCSSTGGRWPAIPAVAPRHDAVRPRVLGLPGRFLPPTATPSPTPSPSTGAPSVAARPNAPAAPDDASARAPSRRADAQALDGAQPRSRARRPPSRRPARRRPSGPTRSGPATRSAGSRAVRTTVARDRRPQWHQPIASKLTSARS